MSQQVEIKVPNIGDFADVEVIEILVSPGGFTYGDDISAGKILANELRLKLGDEGLERELGTELEAAIREAEDLELRTMLQGADDHRDAILTVHPGAGGLESQDWAEMLLRMYTRWGERRGFTVTVLDLQPAEEAGIRAGQGRDIGRRR